MLSLIWLPRLLRPSVWRRLLATVSLVYAAGVLALFWQRLTLQPAPTWLLVLSNFWPFLFLPLLIVIPMALLLRSRLALLPALVLLVLFLGLYGPRLLPALRPAPATASFSLRVMTFNLQYDHPEPLQAVAAIRAAGADIVGVQELSGPMAELLRQNLSDLYPYTALEPSTAGTPPFGNGILSRHPILSSELLTSGGIDWESLHAVVEVQGVPVDVVVAHPPPPFLPWYDRHRMSGPLNFYSEAAGNQLLTGLAEQVAAMPGPVILLGDLNLSEESQGYRAMTEPLVDSFRQAGAGFGFSFPNNAQVFGRHIGMPLVRIDYILHSQELTALDAGVHCDGGSDHCYVVADLTRPAGGQ